MSNRLSPFEYVFHRHVSVIACCVILRLAEWVAGASDREKQREERRKDRMERRRAEAEGRMHRFADNQYMEQKEQVASNLDDALTQVCAGLTGQLPLCLTENSQQVLLVTSTGLTKSIYYDQFYSLHI